uniref:Uncharacterized protein n=1 Tax=Corethron hystrix TaxID=216773 RepID=A0A7S1FUJ9_9STRA|mmetsp:Transcript_33188/g.76582  ORF Transcript_33188/g.76582 Transcript_33188/m.76582 type:complete len:448 (+) Transcript_33188:1114-2457(+)
MECKSEETKDTRSYDETIFLNMNLWETEEDNMEVIDSVLINKYEERTKQITRFEPRSRSSISLVTGVGNINVRESKSEETHKSDETDDTESVVMEEKTIESPSKVRVEKRQKRTPASPWQAKLKNMLLGLRNNGMKKDKRPAQAMPSENVFEPERGIHLGDSFACSTLTNVFGSYLDQEEEEKARDANFPPDNNITSVPYPKKSRLDLEDYEAVAEMYERVVNQCKNFNKGSVVQKPYVPKYKSMSTRGGHLEYESDIPYDEANDILIDEALTRETSDQKFEKVAQMLKEKIKPEHTELPPEPKICEKPKTDTVADVLKLESSRKTNDCMDIRIATGGKQRKAMVDMKKRVRRKTPSPPNCTDNSVPSIRENDAMYCITPLPTVHEPLTEGLLHECKLVEGNSFDIEVGSGSNIDVYSTKVSSDKSTVVSVKKSSSSKSADCILQWG